MIRSEIVKRLIPIRRLCVRLKSTSDINIEKLEEESAMIEVIDEEDRTREEEIQRKRNKSRLQPQHYNIVHEKPPYSEATHWSHGTLKYQRKLYGRYGDASGVNPALCWPTEQELADQIEYESIAYPFTVQEMIAQANTQRQEKNDRMDKRQAEIVKKMEKLEFWKQDLRNRIAKKESDAVEAKNRKDRLVEEVRRHFGYTVDPRDEKFKEMLEKKEKEQKKAMKEARRKVKEEKLVAKLLSKKSDGAEDNETNEVENSQTKQKNKKQ